MNRLLGFITGITSVIVGLSPVQAITIIDIPPATNSVAGVFGEIMMPGQGVSGAYGQTITVPDKETVLADFTFTLGGGLVLIDGRRADPIVNFAGYVAAWDSVNSRAVGSILYRSAPRSYFVDEVFVKTESFTFNTGGLNLVSGQQYILFLSAFELFNGTPDGAVVLIRTDNPYTGGDFFVNNGVDFSSLTTTSWNNSGNDMVFKATFIAPASVPETSSAVALSALGFLGLVLNQSKKPINS